MSTPTSDARKTVTALFTDLADSTALAGQLDPETLARVLDRYFGEVRAVIERYGGSVEKYIGDAVVGIFGVPKLHEDDALRAVRAALEMQEALARLNTELEARFGVALHTRTGINSGDVVVGGAAEARGMLAVGQPVSIAARLEQAAGRSEILVGEETQRLVDGAVDLEPIEPLSAKGVTAPLAAWRVLGLRDVQPRGWAEAGPFVGRERELQAVAGAVDGAIADRRCLMVTVIAPPGFGKSRLAAETAARLTTVRTLVGRCVAYGEADVYAPLIEIVRAIETEEGRSLDGLLGNAQDREQVAATLEAIAADGSGVPEQIAWAFRRLLETVSLARPVMAAIEDIHWADPLLLDLLDYVAAFSVGHPIVLLCTARPELLELRPAWASDHPGSPVVRLAPLSDDETADLVSRLDVAPSDPAERERIVAAAEGVPLFVEQLAALRAEQSGGGQTRTPPSIRALLAARVDRLSEHERTVLERGAIVGEAFSFDDLRVLVEADATEGLPRAVMALVRKELVRPEQGVAIDTIRFSHALVREAVLERMPRRTRAELHERFADRSAGGAVRDELRAHHLEAALRERIMLGGDEAENVALAARTGSALLAAGRRSLARQESRRAAVLLARAAELLARPSERLAALADLISALFGVPDLDAAERVHAEALAEAQSAGERDAELAIELAWVRTGYLRDEKGWQERNIALAEAAIEHFAPLGDDAMLGRAWYVIGTARSGRDIDAMTDALRQARLHAERANDERTLIDVWDDLGGAMLAGRTPFPETLDFTRQELAWAREHGVVFAEADATLGEAYGLAAAGDTDAARSALERARVLFAELPGVVSQHGETYVVGAQIERDTGRPQEAEALDRRAMELLAAGGLRRWWRTAAIGLANTLVDLGRLDEAAAVVDEIADQPFTASPAGEAGLLMVRARLAAARGDAVAGVELARGAVERIAGSPALLAVARARETSGDLLRAVGEGSAASADWRAAEALYAEKVFMPGLERVRAKLAL